MNRRVENNSSYACFDINKGLTMNITNIILKLTINVIFDLGAIE